MCTCMANYLSLHYDMIAPVKLIHSIKMFPNQASTYTGRLAMTCSLSMQQEMITEEQIHHDPLIQCPDTMPHDSNSHQRFCRKAN